MILLIDFLDLLCAWVMIIGLMGLKFKVIGKSQMSRSMYILHRTVPECRLVTVARWGAVVALSAAAWPSEARGV